MTEIIKYRGREIRIEQDQDARSPQEDGDGGLYLIGLHRQFFVEPPSWSKSHGRFNESAAQAEIEDKTTSHHIFGLEAYIHGGVALSLAGEGRFPDRQWDVSQLGAVFVSKDEWPDKDEARAAALSLIETWNQCLSGDVWGYVVGDDSCWGFYGQEYAISEAKSAVDYQLDQELKAKLAKLKAFIQNRVPVCYRKFETA